MQRALLGFFALCATSLSFAPPAAAGGLRWPWEDDDCCPPCAPVCAPAPCAPVCAPVCAAPQPQPCVPQTIPACVEVRTRTVERPAVICQVQVPKYEEVSHPVYETKCTPSTARWSAGLRRSVGLRGAASLAADEGCTPRQVPHFNPVRPL
jgi:hypothetical protein